MSAARKSDLRHEWLQDYTDNAKRNLEEEMKNFQESVVKQNISLEDDLKMKHQNEWDELASKEFVGREKKIYDTILYYRQQHEMKQLQKIQRLQEEEIKARFSTELAKKILSENRLFHQSSKEEKEKIAAYNDWLNHREFHQLLSLGIKFLKNDIDELEKDIKSKNLQEKFEQYTRTFFLGNEKTVEKSTIINIVILMQRFLTTIHRNRNVWKKDFLKDFDDDPLRFLLMVFIMAKKLGVETDGEHPPFFLYADQHNMASAVKLPITSEEIYHLEDKFCRIMGVYNMDMKFDNTIITKSDFERMESLILPENKLKRAPNLDDLFLPPSEFKEDDTKQIDKKVIEKFFRKKIHQLGRTNWLFSIGVEKRVIAMKKSLEYILYFNEKKEKVDIGAFMRTKFEDEPSLAEVCMRTGGFGKILESELKELIRQESEKIHTPRTNL